MSAASASYPSSGSSRICRNHHAPTSILYPVAPSWPKHAKAATLHVISLAHFVLTHVRGWAANSPIHRVRLAGKCDRLNSEVAMQREEIRIKDARMAAMSPPPTPALPAQRAELVALFPSPILALLLLGCRRHRPLLAPLPRSGSFQEATDRRPDVHRA